MNVRTNIQLSVLSAIAIFYCCSCNDRPPSINNSDVTVRGAICLLHSSDDPQLIESIENRSIQIDILVKGQGIQSVIILKKNVGFGRVE